jgi:spore coat polysaccharide biosynthesis predicted glycosyltransferase SpsG
VKQSGIEVLTHEREPGSAADASEVIAVASARGCDWVVVDSYDAERSFQEQLRDAGLRVLLIDDYAASERISADIVVNQNVFASRAMYDGRLHGEPQLLLGPSFALLRPEFSRAEKAEARRPRRRSSSPWRRRSR